MSASSPKVQPFVKSQEHPRARPVQAAEVQTDLSTNEIAKIVLSPELKDDAKVSQLTKTIKAETLKDLQTFSTYLANQRTRAQRRLLELTSTTAFPRLQSVIGNLQGGVVDVDNLMQPMTADLQAAFDLRTNNQMNNAMKQITEDRIKEAEWSDRKTKINAEYDNLHDDERQIKRTIAFALEDKTWLGNVRRSALQTIAEQKLKLEELTNKKTRLHDDQLALVAEQEQYHTRTDEYKEQRERLRKMLDLGPGYVSRVEEIVAKAIKFIDDSSREVGEIRGEFDGLEEQSRNILRSNAQMVRVTAILDRSIDGANDLHKMRVKELSAAPPDEDTLARVTRTQEKNDVERFVSALTETAVSTKKNVSALEEDAVSANNFSSVVTRQQTNLRELHGDGIASITTNLNVALQAFNTAALTEAGNNAWQAIGDMNEVTNKIRNNQVVASAMSLDDTNKRIIERFTSLSGVSDALKEANKLRSDGISNIASNLKELAERTAKVRQDLQVSIGLDSADDPKVAIGEAPRKTAEKSGDDFFMKI